MVGGLEGGAVFRTMPSQPVRLWWPPGTIYPDFPGTGPDNRPSGHLRRGGTTRIAESIGAARRNLSGGMTAIRPMQRRERAIVGGRYLNSAYGMPAASSLASRRSSRSEEHTSELQSLMRISYAVFCLKKKIKKKVQE